MAVYHVNTSPLTGRIYAGTIEKSGVYWKNKSDVTDEAIAAVRDMFIMSAGEHYTNVFGYEWTMPDGRKVLLYVRIQDSEAKI